MISFQFCFRELLYVSPVPQSRTIVYCCSRCLRVRCL